MYWSLRSLAHLLRLKIPWLIAVVPLATAMQATLPIYSPCALAENNPNHNNQPLTNVFSLAPSNYFDLDTTRSESYPFTNPPWDLSTNTAFKFVSNPQLSVLFLGSNVDYNCPPSEHPTCADDYVDGSFILNAPPYNFPDGSVLMARTETGVVYKLQSLGNDGENLYFYSDCVEECATPPGTPVPLGFESYLDLESGELLPPSDSRGDISFLIPDSQDWPQMVRAGTHWFTVFLNRPFSGSISQNEINNATWEMSGMISFASNNLYVVYDRVRQKLFKVGYLASNGYMVWIEFANLTLNPPPPLPTPPPEPTRRPKNPHPLPLEFYPQGEEP